MMVVLFGACKGAGAGNSNIPSNTPTDPNAARSDYPFYRVVHISHNVSDLVIVYLQGGSETRRDTIFAEGQYYYGPIVLGSGELKMTYTVRSLDDGSRTQNTLTMSVPSSTFDLDIYEDRYEVRLR